MVVDLESLVVGAVFDLDLVIDSTFVCHFGYDLGGVDMWLREW